MGSLGRLVGASLGKKVESDDFKKSIFDCHATNFNCLIPVVQEIH